MGKAARARLAKLERLYASSKPCACSVVTNPIEWQDAELSELRRYIALSKAAELIVPRACEDCGKPTLRSDLSLLSSAEQIELKAIEMAVRERTDERQKRTQGASA